jgi:signal peptidase
MEPDLPVGALAFTRSVSPDELRVGDDATFAIERNGAYEYLTHRIVEILSSDDPGVDTMFVTRGIANPDNDPNPRLAQNAVGRIVFSIPYGGFALELLRSNIVPIVVIILCLTLAVFLLRRLISD